jgi:hypothetical protein
MSVLRSLAFVLSLALSSAALVGASSALASEGETAKIDYRASEPVPEFGTCTADSRVKVRVEADAEGRLEAVGVVFSEGEYIWSWKFKHDNDFSAKGEVRAKDREIDRSFRIVRSMINFEGTDVVTFRAVNETTNEECDAELAY